MAMAQDTTQEHQLTPDHTQHREQLLDAYLAHTKALEHRIEADQHFWTVETMWTLVERDPEGTWTLILDMLQRVDGDYGIASIAAGPLENLIIAHGRRFLDRIEAEAGTNPKFRRPLVGVWGENRMPEELVLRLRELVRDEPPL